MKKYLFPNITWFLLLLIPIVFLGFYPSYFSILFDDMPSIIHVHSFFMVCWVALAIVQPFLISQKKTRAHRFLGKVSYFVMPLVFITGYLMIRHSYFANIDRKLENVANGVYQLTPSEINARAAAGIALGSIYFIWLIIFYVLAVIRRKQVVAHSTYMFAATLTLLGPSAERLIYNIFMHFEWPYTFFVENFIFFFILSVLTALFIHQRRNGNSGKPSAIALGIYLAGILVFFLLPDTKLWQSMVELVMFNRS